MRIRTRFILEAVLIIAVGVWLTTAPKQRYWVQRQFASTQQILSMHWAHEWKSVAARSPYLGDKTILLVSVLFGVVTLVALSLRCRRAWAGAKERRHLDAYVLTDLCRDVIDADGKLENDGAIYPNSRKLNIFLELAHRGSRQSEGIDVAMSLIRPDQTESLFLHRLARPSSGGRCQAMFELTDLSEMRNAPGEWSAEFFAKISGRRLGGMVLNAVDSRAMIDDLELADFRLTSGEGEALAINCAVLNTISSIVPLATLRLRSLNPMRVGGLSVQFVLCSSGQSATMERTDRPVTFNNGICLISDIMFAAEQLRTGSCEVRICCGHRLLGKLAFTLVSREEVLASIRVESFELIATDNSGRQLVLGNSVVCSRFRSVVPVIRLRNPFPLPSQSYHLTVGVSSGESILSYIDDQVTLESLVNEIVAGELSMQDSQPDNSCTFFAMIEDRCLGHRELRLVGEAPKVADVQGRLRFAEMAAPIDMDSEAARLLREVNVVR